MTKYLRFILIDDDPIHNKICNLTIRTTLPGIEVIEFLSPEEGLDYITHILDEKPSVLLLDINMPTMTGWELLDEYEKYRKTVKEGIDIYILSSSVDPRDQEKAGDHPDVKGYLEKPLLKNKILEIQNQS